jgi:hypothetical protein
MIVPMINPRLLFLASEIGGVGEPYMRPMVGQLVGVVGEAAFKTSVSTELESGPPPPGEGVFNNGNPQFVQNRISGGFSLPHLPQAVMGTSSSGTRRTRRGVYFCLE